MKCQILVIRVEKPKVGKFGTEKAKIWHFLSREYQLRVLLMQILLSYHKF